MREPQKLGSDDGGVKRGLTLKIWEQSCFFKPSTMIEGEAAKEKVWNIDNP